jgi:hypothetical protein
MLNLERHPRQKQELQITGHYLNYRVLNFNLTYKSKVSKHIFSIYISNIVHISKIT